MELLEIKRKPLSLFSVSPIAFVSYRAFFYLKNNEGDVLDESICNYQLVMKGSVVARAGDGKEIIAEEDFYPVLFGESNYREYFGFKAKKIFL